MRLLPLLLAWCVGIAPASAVEPWRADLQALKAALARDYANFGHAVQVQRLDLQAMAATAEAGLGAARAADDRRRAVIQLVRAFRDPHLGAFPIPSPAADTAASPPCASFAEGQVSGSVARGAAAPPLAGAEAFDGRLVRTPAGQPLAILRIATFVLAESPACPEALRRAGHDPTRPCPECDVETLVARHLDAALVRSVRAAEAAGASAILIDLTGNPGGGSWAVSAARLLGAPLAPRMALARSPRVEAWARAQARDFAAAGRPAEARLAAALAREAGARCDLSGAWQAPPGTPLPCPSLTATTLRAGDFAEAPTGASAATAPGARPTLPLLLAVDDDTHSSAELFAAQLRDNGAARLVGARTSGAGCGQRTGGANQVDLPALGLRVVMPDCVRLRADGSNERSGLVPDEILPLGPSLALHERAALFLQGIDRMRAR